MPAPPKTHSCAPAQDTEHTTNDVTASPNHASRWKTLVGVGNEEFARHDFTAARASYQCACALADEVFEEWAAYDGDNAVAALAVSYLNLADTEECLQDFDSAANSLRDIHERLLTLSESVHVSTSLRAIAFRHANETFLAITRFQAEHGRRSELTVFGALSPLAH